MNKKINKITIVAIVAILMSSCGGVKREPGRIYMPDMAYSRAYEAYSQLDTMVYATDRTDAHKIYFNAMPVAGTVKRGELAAYTIPNDSVGYLSSATVANPIGDLSKEEMAEAGRLYNINCGVCHGEKGAANGPIAEKIGAVANLTSPTYIAMKDGTMFHSITYGKNNMGSYASQLGRKQRWMVIKYIRTLQPKPETAKADTAKKM